MSPSIGFARNTARRILEQLKIFDAPIRVNSIAEYLNLEIWEYNNLPSKISALLVAKKKLIVINPNHHTYRKRFSISHEIGHYVLNHSNQKKIELEEEVDFLVTNQLNHQYSGEQESEANEFAGELLMPLNIIKLYFKKYKPRELAEKFNVSEEAMWIRLIKLKLIKY